MEFAVIDASTIVRSNFPTTEHDPKLNNNQRLNDLINKLKDVECLDLGCLNILHMTNLCMMSSSNLTSLKLSVNRIDKICNLESLTNLIELDLSHNCIKHIENLQVLVNLRRLILNHNPLTSLQNLDTQRDSLEMLDVGYCKIADLKFALYLKQFSSLVSLVVEGNPLQIEPINSERKFIVSMIQSLLVYNNKMVTVEEKQEALNIYSKLIEMLKTNDKKWKKLTQDKQFIAERTKARKDAFIDRIPEDGDVDFNVSIFCNSTVEEVLRKNNRYGIHNVYRMYAENFRQLVSEITEAAETSRKSRAKLVDEFRDELRLSINHGVEESRKYVIKFMDYEKSLTRDSNDERVPKTSLCDRFDERMRALWLMLMSQEDGLSRKITDMIDELRNALEKQIAELKQLVGHRFGALQRQQNVFLQFVLEYAMSSAQTDRINNRFRRVSQFTNDISQCMESQTLQMNQAESYITKSASQWLDDLFYNLNSEETKRNRRKISEIASFERFQNETFKRNLL